jgi:hypothetical protein
MNTSVETTVDNLEKSISEHNITTNTRLVAFEDKLQSQLNETDLLIQEMNEDFENKLTESDKIIKEGNMKLAENINNVESNMQSTYNGLNNRLYSAESKLRSVATKQGKSRFFLYLHNILTYVPIKLFARHNFCMSVGLLNAVCLQVFLGISVKLIAMKQF